MDRRILRPGSSSGFQEHAAEAIKAIFTSAAGTFPNSWPVHYVPYWPGKEVRDVLPCTPAASNPAAEWWPKLGLRAVLKQRPSQSNQNGSCVGQAVHEDAVWYLSCCCLHRQNGCPVECLIMQTRLQPRELQVIFSGDCSHTSDGKAVGNLSGVAREEAVEAARGLAPAFAHAQSLADRPLTHQLDNTASSIGLNTTVLRKAISEDRIKQFRRHPDDVVSVQLLGKEVAAKDRAATPASEQSNRLMYGDTLMVSALEDSNFIIVRTTDGQLNRWRRWGPLTGR